MVDKIIEYILNKNRFIGIILVVVAVAIFVDGAFNTFARFKQIPSRLSILIGLMVIISLGIVIGIDKVGNYSSKARKLARFLVLISIFVLLFLGWKLISSIYVASKFFLGLGGLILAFFSLIVYYIIERNIQNSKLFNILFFEFSDGASEEIPKDRYITFSVQKELSKRFHGTNISIINIREVVINAEKAFLRGKNAEAKAVIYGVYSKRKTNIILDLGFEVIKKPTYYQQFDLKTKILPMDELDKGRLEILIETDYANVTNFLMGLFEYSSGNYKKAIDTFNSLVIEMRNITDFSSLNDDVIYLYLGNSYYLIGDLERSKHNFEKALIANRNNPKVLHNIGVIEYQIGNILNSIKFFSEALAFDDQLIVAYRNRAFAFIKQKKYQEALIDLLKCLELKPFDADVLKLIAICKKNLEIHYEAIRYFKLARKAQYYDLKITFDLIDEYIAVKDYLNAVVTSLSLVYSVKRIPLILGFWADKLVGLKKYKSADLFYGLAILFKRGNYSLYFSRSNIRFVVGKTDSAIKDLKRVIDLNPNFIDAYFNLGNVYMAQGEYLLAKEVYSKGISLSPMYANFYYSRAQAMVVLKEYADVIRDCEEYINLTQSEEIKIYELLGIAFLGLSVFGVAIDHLEKVHQKMPSERSKKNLDNAHRAYEEYLSYVKLPA